MKFPKSIKIGGHKIQIHMAPINDGSYGQYIAEEDVILINTEMSKTQQEATLLHEILHVLNAYFDNGIKHAFMESLSQQLYQVLKDNKISFK